jgi:GT2 family glycosyltransferase
MAPALEACTDPNRIPSRLDEAPACDVSVVVATGGWPEDLERLAASLARECGGTDHELVVVANASPEVAEAADRLGARGVQFTQRVGWAAAANAGISQSLGRTVVLALTCVEAAGDFLQPLGAALADPAVGLAGPWGLTTRDLRTFEEQTTGAVHAMQGYCMAFRRADLRTVGLLDPAYKFYRNADIDWSLRWLDRGFGVRALGVPLRRHAHREWEELDPAQREKKSRDNFARLLRRWRDRTDLVEKPLT